MNTKVNPQGKQRTTIWIDPKLVGRVKAWGVLNQTSFSKIVEEALDKFVPEDKLEAKFEKLRNK